MKLSNILFLICLVSALVACGGAEERKAAYLEKAKHSLEIGDLEKARIELKNVLQIDPKDARAYFLLGNIFGNKKELRKAFANYSKASELDPDNSEYHAKLGRLYLLFARDLDKAIEKRDIILNKDKDNIHGLLLNAGILLHQNKKDDALTIINDVFTKHPDNIESTLLLATFYSNDKKYDEAEDVVNIGLSRNPDAHVLKDMLANILFLSGNYEQAEIVLKDILELHPDKENNYMKLAIFYQKTGRTEDAILILRQSSSEDADDVTRRLVLVKFIQQAKSVDAAIKEIQNQIAIKPNIGRLRIGLGELYIASNNPESAEKTFKKTIQDFPEDEYGIQSRIYLAKLYIQKKELDEAERIINDAINISPNDPAVNLIKAKLSLISKDYEQVVISSRTIIKSTPENIAAYILLASAHKANGEDDQADAIITQAHENNRSNTKALLSLSQYHIKNNNASQAEKIIDDYLSIDKDNYEALTIKGGILTRSMMYDEAKQYVDRMLLMHPEKENGYLYSAASLLANNKQDKIVALLEKGYEKTNHNKKILLALTKYQVSLKEYDLAIKRIEDEISEEGNDVDLYMALSSVYIASGNLKQAEKSLRQIIQIKPDANLSYLTLANFYLKNSQKDQASRVLKDGLKIISNDLAISLSLARLYEVDKAYDSAINIYEDILKIHTDQVVVMNNLASLLSDHRTDTSSLNRAKELADMLKDSNQPPILDTVGWVYYRLGNYTDAVSILKSVVEDAPNISVFNYHLGMAYYKNDDKNAAKKFLSKALENDVNFTGRTEAEKLLKTL